MVDLNLKLPDSFFLEEERNGREGGSEGLSCSERGYFLAQTRGWG